MNTIELTRNELKTCGKTYREVAAATGLSYHWVQKFACGQRGAGAARFLRLREYLDQLRAQQAA